jgi:pimeloyl-ACP methyl ester carboxylesterase
METRRIPFGSDSLFVRTQGSGPPLLFIHGWPLNGLTFRHLASRLAPHFTCHLLDLPGAGESSWSKDTDFSPTGAVGAIRAVVDGLDLRSYGLVAFDSGAAMARHLAAGDPRVVALVAGNTEIPGHRPPWVPLYIKMTRLPGAAALFRRLVASRRFRRSSMGFGGCFHDLSLLDGEFHELFVAPLIRSREAMGGQLGYARRWDWSFVDALAEADRKITVPVKLIWGEGDPFFPVAKARSLPAGFGGPASLVVLDRARLLVHEERPDAFAAEALPFLKDCFAKRAAA